MKALHRVTLLSAMAIGGCAVEFDQPEGGVTVAGSHAEPLLATQCQFNKAVSKWAGRFYARGWDFGCDSPHEVCIAGFCQLRASCSSPQFSGSLEVRQNKRGATDADNYALPTSWLKGGVSIGSSNGACSCSTCNGYPAWPSL